MLDRIEATLQRALDANAQMIGRVTRSPHLARELWHCPRGPLRPAFLVCLYRWI